MRIRHARGVAGPGGNDRHYPVGGRHDLAAKLHRPGQAGEPALEAEAVDDEELGASEEPRLVGARLEDMGVGIAADQARHHHLAAADPAHDVVENAERDDDAKRRGGRRLTAPDEQDTDGREPAATGREHVMAYHPSPIASEPHMTASEPSSPVPVTLLTGFLGSGKTTVLNHVLKQPDMAATAVIVNEFGEIGLDHLLVERASEDVVLLNSGCLCCTVRNDIVDTLTSLFVDRAKGKVPWFTRVVIETTGLADPAPILHTLMTQPIVAARYMLDGVVTTVDAVNGAATLDRQPEAVKQAAVADRLLLTKTDLAEPALRRALEARLKALNPSAPLIPVAQGAADLTRLFNLGFFDPATKSVDVQRWLRDEAFAVGHQHHHDEERADPNRHDDRIRAFCITRERPILWR